MSGLPFRAWPHPVPSFVYPAVVPSADPGDTPLVSAAWNSDYTPLILGACSQLMLESSLFSTSMSDVTKLGKMNDLLRIIGNAAPNTLPSVVHSRTFNFAPSADDWSVIPGLYGVHVPDVGWCSEGWLESTGHWWSRIDIQFTMPTAYPIRGINVPAGEIDQTGWLGVVYTLDFYNALYALSPAGVYASNHSQYTLVPGYTNSQFQVSANTVGTVNVSSGKVELHMSLRGFVIDPDSTSPEIRIIIPSIVLEWFEPS